MIFNETKEKIRDIVSRDTAKWNRENPGVIYKCKIHRPKWLRLQETNTT